MRKKIESISVYPGAKIGAWTVLEECPGEKKRRWKCRCECGTERDVLDRSLRYGGSMGCGCQSRKRIAEKNADDLTGRRFGHIQVLGKADPIHGRIGRCWLCRCDCRREIVLPGTELLTGHKEHCGCRAIYEFMFVDITAKKFGRIKALYPLEQTNRTGCIIWHCVCECGKELDVSYSRLVSGSALSCGCLKRGIEAKPDERSDKWKLSKNNTSGIKGVYLNQGRYEAVIIYKRKRYWLGSYRLFADAARARHEAETLIQEQVKPFYTRWQEKADADPDWAASNPIQISIKSINGVLRLDLLPDT